MKAFPLQIRTLLSSRATWLAGLTAGLAGWQVWNAPVGVGMCLACTIPNAIARVMVERRRKQTKDKAIDLARERTSRGDPLRITDGPFSVQTGRETFDDNDPLRGPEGSSVS